MTQAIPTSTDINAATANFGQQGPGLGPLNSVLQGLAVNLAAGTGGSGGALGPYANVAALQTANPASTNIGKHATVGSAPPYADYVSNGTAWVPAGGGGVLGPFASYAAMQSASPAASNTGAHALVGAAAPYLDYMSDGIAWQQDTVVMNANLVNRANAFMQGGLKAVTRTRATPILDSMAGTALGAWGFARLKSAYAGQCCNVIRDFDSVTRDIPFASDGLVDTALMIAFAGNSTLHMVTLYDQIGTNNLTQATPSARPTIDLKFLNNGVPNMNAGDQTTFLPIPAGVAITSRANCSIWLACALKTNQVGQSVWDMGSTFGNFTLELTPVSAFSVQMRIAGSNVTFPNGMANTPQARVSVVGVNSAAGGCDLYTGSGLKSSVAALASGAFTGGFLPSNTAVAEVDPYAFVVFNAALTANDAQLMQYGLAANFGATTGYSANVVLQGDSIVAGALGYDYNYKRLLEQMLPANISVFSFGHSGDTLIGNGLSNASQYIDPLFRTGMVNVCVGLFGVNDISAGTTAATLLTNVDTWVAARRAAGYKAVYGTLFSRNISGSFTTAMETQRALFNAGLRARFASGGLDDIVDFDLDPSLVPISATDFPDNLHPSVSFGYQKVTPILFNALVRQLPTVAPVL